jgi:hypothetical protein
MDRLNVFYVIACSIKGQMLHLVSPVLNFF